MKKILSLTVLALLAVVLTVGIFAADTFTNPVANGADPFVFKDDDGTYYLYSTNSNDYGFRTYSSKNLVEWTAEGFCLTESDVYVNPIFDEGDLYDFWAPEVTKYNGKYYMVFSFKSTLAKKNRLCIAVADSPKGPFKCSTESYLFPFDAALDAHFFHDDDGKIYLYFAASGTVRLNGQYTSGGSNIWGGEMDMETLTVKEETIKLLVSWDPKYEVSANIVEGPAMLKNDGIYYLTFSSGAWQSTDYSVCYATSKSPLGPFVRDGKGEAFASDDRDYSDNDNPHLYGTAHHSFVEAPNGKDTLIVYHTHRTGKTWSNTVSELYSPRSACIDHVWFEDGKLLIGSKENPGVPTATPQPLLEGTTLERKQYFAGAFENIPTLPTVYVANTDGNDENDGSKSAPVRSLSKAFAILKKGGTIVLTQGYTCGDRIEIPTSRGPVMITAEHNNVVFTFKYMSIKTSALYFDNIILAPESEEDIAVIECNFNNVVFGEGISCLNRPFDDLSYPYLVGGKWKYGGTSTDSVYNSYKYEESALTSTKTYTLAVLGGKWEMVEVGSVNYKTPVEGSAVGGSLVTEGSALGEPSAPATPEAPEAIKTEIKMTVNSTVAYVNGEAKTLDAPPINRGSRTMLPVRFLANSLGIDNDGILWDDSTKTVTLKNSTTTIVVTIGAPSMTVNGETALLDSPALIENSRTYLPLRAIANALGVSNDNITWDDSTKTVALVK